MLCAIFRFIQVPGKRKKKKQLSSQNPNTLGCFSVAGTKFQGQRQLKKDFILAYGSRGLEPGARTAQHGG